MSDRTLTNVAEMLAEIDRLSAENAQLRLTELPSGWMAAPKADWDRLDERASGAEGLRQSMYALESRVEVLKAELAEAQAKLDEIELAEVTERRLRQVAEAGLFEASSDRMKLKAELAAARERERKLREELTNIATADPSKWEDDVRPQFREWAQNRARAALRDEPEEPPKKHERVSASVPGTSKGEWLCNACDQPWPCAAADQEVKP